jgi:hypothetical protein
VCKSNDCVSELVTGSLRLNANRGRSGIGVGNRRPFMSSLYLMCERIGSLLQCRKNKSNVYTKRWSEKVPRIGHHFAAAHRTMKHTAVANLRMRACAPQPQRALQSCCRLVSAPISAIESCILGRAFESGTLK